MRKIIDCFTFFNELDLLEIRLKYLYDVVDHFVIVEADKTFKGNDKPFNLRDNMHRFEIFKDKMLYTPITLKEFTGKKVTEWEREGYQRDCIKMGLKKLVLDDNDFILISDLDEIPDKEILKSLVNGRENHIPGEIGKKSRLSLITKGIYYLFKRMGYKLTGNKKYKAQLNTVYFTVIKEYAPPINFNMVNCAYFINYVERKNLWHGLQCAEAKWLTVLTPNEIRTMRNFPVKSIYNSGWHFSYLGGKETIKHKLKNFSHQEYNIPQIVSDEYIDFCISKGYSLFEYYKHPDVKPLFEKKQISYLPADLRKIVVAYKNFIAE